MQVRTKYLIYLSCPVDASESCPRSGQTALQHHLDGIADAELNFGPASEQHRGQAESAAAGRSDGRAFAACRRWPQCQLLELRCRRSCPRPFPLLLSPSIVPSLSFTSCRSGIPGRSLHCARQHDRVSVGEDHGIEVHQQFGAALHVARPLHPPNFALDEGSRAESRCDRSA